MNLSQKFPFRKGWVVGITGGAIALGLLGLGVSRLIAPTPVAESESVATPLQRVEVAALGRLEPRGEVIRVSGPNTELLKRLNVKQGDAVRAGDVLGYLDSYEERLAERDFAASQLVEARQRLEATTQLGEAQIQEAQTRIQQIQAPGGAETEALRANVRQLESELTLATQDLARQQSLRQAGAISQQALDQQVSTTRQAQERLKNAQALLAQNESEQAANLRNAQAQAQSQQANLPVAQVETAVQSSQENLNLAEARLERTIIRAPSSGRVLRVVTRAGEAIGTDGILDLGDTSQMFVVAEVYETDVGLVRPGQPAVISSRNGAFNEPLTGKVSSIGWQIFKNDVLDDDPAANADSRVVEVKIQLDNGKAVEALTNLQVDVKIDVQP
ncbi:MAG: efflux RND transporter periplasmic adaptor subunit [Timaviella obliquedivisa GSE-PSE-MK23-08B]|jgi:HlyD family secretion protein|nr:efflux RND transporter periplasmic adaptor subunit [Timaviella obliquedivisa GSE-PSE-MK23-08B]